MLLTWRCNLTTTQYKISRNIPIPEKAPPKLARLRPPSIYPFQDMKPGDSFLVPISDATSSVVRKVTSRVYQAYYARRKKHPEEKYVHYVFPTGVRVWRVA